MKILLLCIGKTTYKPFKESIERYATRLVHYVPFEYRELPDVRTTKSLTEEKQKQMEGSSVQAVLQPGDFLMLLDERGKEMTSVELSRFLENKMNTLPGRLVFLIGGPYGFSEEIYQRANGKLSLSKMTFPHELVRIFITEQIYRACTILKGEPYHHE